MQPSSEFTRVLNNEIESLIFAHKACLPTEPSPHVTVLTFEDTLIFPLNCSLLYQSLIGYIHVQHEL